ncbi:hypothetical protein CY34DRAFT_659262 [Suillus luteus UH-Slu-Lm8-n1]|uniref:Uncharacterized protein n=1 Tax=Suillus luteus UH-Slu-Lm8-n1 TaxID=930992 RepID=A0A0D0AIM2_9AGAM|nr:hypothetical protein CY34DRAFT_659262 [Suillus luteus UH-Slu-Lm8-n1]
MCCHLKFTEFPVKMRDGKSIIAYSVLAGFGARHVKEQRSSLKWSHYGRLRVPRILRISMHQHIHIAYDEKNKMQ